MVKKAFHTICLFVALGVLVTSIAFALIYETRTQQLTQTILRRWLSGWDKRVKLTVDHDSVSSNLTNFPILVYLSTSSGRNHDDLSFVFDELLSDSNQKKIAVTTDDKTTQCYVEIEKWDTATEKAWMWIKAPSISSLVDTNFYLYYDKDHVDNTGYVGITGSAPAQNVWDSNYKGVWHLKENPSGTAPQMKDSTSNNNGGTSAGSMLSGDQITGQIDGSLDFDGSNDEINSGNGASLQITSALTVEAWAKTASTGSVQGIVSKQVSTYNGYQLRKYSDNKYRFGVGNPGTYYATSNVAYTDSNWHYVVGVKSSTNYLYMDGAQQTSTFSATLTDSGSSFNIGRAYSNYNGYWWNGQIDEVRVSNVARSSAWIYASYKTGCDSILDFATLETF
jgi:hypothetical protein